jgi:hypothetical protein
MKKLSIVGLVALISSLAITPAGAQDRTTASYDREISITYSALRDVGHIGGGFLVDFGKQIATVGGMQTSLVGEFGMNQFSYWDEKYTSVNGGVRFGAMTSNRLRPFAQVVAGLQRDFGENGINIQPGAGMNIRIARSIDLKAQVDFPIVRWLGDTYKQVRVSTGIGLPLGR